MNGWDKREIMTFVCICFLCYAIGQIIGFSEGERYGVWWERERARLARRPELKPDPEATILDEAGRAVDP